MKELTETLVRTLVDNPDQVSVSAIDGEQSSLVEIRVSKTDLGQVIGRQGHTVEALRAILNSVAAKDKKKVLVDVIE
jgi:predicted RNA-binding protein YlqC (UPF0109 family)